MTHHILLLLSWVILRNLLLVALLWLRKTILGPHHLWIWPKLMIKLVFYRKFRKRGMRGVNAVDVRIVWFNWHQILIDIFTTYSCPHGRKTT